MKPVIGIVTRPDYLQSGRSVDIIYTSIRKAIIKAGGIPLPLTIPTENIYDIESKKNHFDDLIFLLQQCDGFVFQGGDNFYDYDLYIVKYAYEHDIPSLGICLGMQLMACMKNGSLKEIGSDCHHSSDHYVHDVFIKEKSLLDTIFKTRQLPVNSRHRECVQTTDLEVIATASDGIIEAICDSDKRFFLGIQWHPEDMIAYDKLTMNLWNRFLLESEEWANENRRLN